MRIKETRTTTATSPSRTCRRCSSIRPGSARSGRPCPSCRPRDGRATSDELGLSPVRRRRSWSPTRDAARLFEETLGGRPALEAKPVANWVTGEYMRLRKPRGRGRSSVVDPAQLAAIVRAGRRRGDLPGTTPGRSWRSMPASGASAASIIADRGLRQINDAGALGAAVDGCWPSQPGRGRRLPSREGPGGRLPGRPGHEGHAGPGQRGASSGSPSASGSPPARGRGADVGVLNIVLLAGGRGSDRHRLRPGQGAVVPLPDAQGAGAECRPVPGVARRRSGTTARPARRVAMEVLRGKSYAGLIAVAGFVLVFLGFFIR